MKKFLQKNLIAAFSMAIIASEIAAQTPMHFTSQTPGGQNSIPFNSGAQMVWRRAQFCIPAGSMGTVPPGNNITTIYIHTGSAANVTYPTFTVRLKTASAAGMQGTANGPFESGMTQVFTATNFNMVTTANSWFAIPLQVPFLYDPTFPLIVDFEHDHSSAAGPIINQPGAVGLTGSNGRQWGNNNNAPISGVGTQLLNFGIDIIPATPCTAAPPSNTITPASFTTCPGLGNPLMGLAQTYSFGGITYQWNSSTVSPVGPFQPISNATMMTTQIPTLGVTTWFQLVATCTNISTGNTTTLNASQFFVSPPTSSVIPYHEDFEGIQMTNRLPNCSWSASSLGNMNQTSMSAGSGNRLPRSGSKFASFSNVSPGTSYYYTNPIQMNTGITYSAALWFATEYFGYSNWSELSIWVGPNQSPTGLVQVASISPAISGPYKLLDGTFTVPSPGQYYVAIKATSQGGGATYLSWDDLSVTIPCTPESANSPTVILSVPNSTICQGDVVSANAIGADSFMWYDGTQTSTHTLSPPNTTIVTVKGTNTLTGCETTASELIIVNPSPTLMVVSDKNSVCPGQGAYLTAYGASSYVWPGGNLSSVNLVKPAITTQYTVQGINQYLCSKEAVITITVLPQPTVTAVAEGSGESCMGDAVVLNASGADSYVWLQSSSPVMLQGSPVTITLMQPTTFTLIGTAANSCTNAMTVSQNVQICNGIESLNLSQGAISAYPVPTKGVITITLGGAKTGVVEISDVSGRVLSSTIATNSSVDADLSHLANGIYYATVKTDNTTKIIRVVKN